jgi:hypothetical protein
VSKYNQRDATKSESMAFNGKLGYYCYRYIGAPIGRFFYWKYRHFLLFHTYASTLMVISLWLIWIFMISFFILCMMDVFGSGESYYWQD